MLNYDQRKSAVTNHLGHLLSGYEPPYNLRDDQAKQVREATEVAELIINTLPTSLNEKNQAGKESPAGQSPNIRSNTKSGQRTQTHQLLSRLNSTAGQSQDKTNAGEAIRRATPEPADRSRRIRSSRTALKQRQSSEAEQP